MDWWSNRPTWQKAALGGFGALVILGALFGTGDSDENGEAESAAATTSAPAAEDSAASDAEIAALTAERDELMTQLTDAQSALEAATSVEAELRAQLETVDSELSELETLRTQVEEAATAQEAAETEMAELLAAYDAELAASRDALLTSIDGEICELHSNTDPTTGSITTAINKAISGSPEYTAAFAGWSTETTFDVEALSGIVTECNLQEVLIETKGDGFYTVGDEIKPGKWRSTGDGDSCYWARLNSNQDILDNHFGNAGGTVTIRSSDYEVEFSGCGTWEYLG